MIEAILSLTKTIREFDEESYKDFLEVLSNIRNLTEDEYRLFEEVTSTLLEGLINASSQNL